MKPTYRNIAIIILVILLLGGGLYAVAKIEPKQEEVIDPGIPVTVYQTDQELVNENAQDLSPYGLDKSTRTVEDAIA